MALQWGTVPARVAPGPQTSLATLRPRPRASVTVAMAPPPAFGGPAAAAAADADAAAAAWTVVERWGARTRQAPVTAGHPYELTSNRCAPVTAPGASTQLSTIRTEEPP